MKEEEVNFSRHTGQTAQASGQHTMQDFGGRRGLGGQGISLQSLNRFHHQPSMFLQKVRVVIY